MILEVWKRFDKFPMETITKAWMLKHRPSQRQRTVNQMRAHRMETGAAGNCFDLAIWLLEEFRTAGVESYAIGEKSEHIADHVALIAVAANGERWLCDLGDLWIQPYPIDQERTPPQPGYFTGARVEHSLKQTDLHCKYHRSNGKFSEQTYDLTPLSDEELIAAGNISQGQLSPPLVEMRHWRPEETVHWEFANNESLVSSMSGLVRESPAANLAEWAARIGHNTGMHPEYVRACLEAYEEL